MTGNLAIDLAISLAGIAVLVALSLALGAMRSAVVTLDTAAERLAFDEPDFLPREWMVGMDGKSAAALSAGGDETALVFAVGDGFASRRFRRGKVGLEKDGAAIIFRLGEPSRGTVTLAAPDEAVAAQWLLRLAGRRL